MDNSPSPEMMPGAQTMSNQNFSQSGTAILSSVPFYIQTAINGGNPNNAGPKSVLSRRSGIIIDNWTPGNPEQMWQFNGDGSISPAGTTSLVLTAQSTSPTSCVQITLEPFASDQQLTTAQIWTVNGNYLSVNMSGSIGTVYLNLYGANQSPGTIVITYEYSTGDNEKWFLFPATPVQIAGNSFYIQTALSGSENGQANPYVMANNNGVVIDQFSPGSSAQIWSVNGNGTISPANDSGYVLTADSSGSGQVTLQKFDSSTQTPSAEQTWYQGEGQFCVNLGTWENPNNLFLSVQGDGTPASGTAVITYTQTKDNNEYWILIDAAPIMNGDWFYLKTQMPNNANDRSEYVMTVSQSTGGAGTAVVIEPMLPGAAAQLWKMTPGGTIISALNLSMCLSEGGDEQNVTIQNVGDTNFNQQWFLMSNGMLANGTSGDNFYLNVQDGGNASSGANLITYGFSIASNETWVPIPYLPQGLWFTIRNSAYAPDGPLSTMLSVTTDGSVTLAGPEGGSTTPTGQAAIYQLWRKTIDGFIVSATNPSLALTALGSDGGLGVSLIGTDNTNQKWITGYSQYNTVTVNGKAEKIIAGTLESVSFGQVLNNTTLQAPPSQSQAYTASELWYIVPQAMPFGESTTIGNRADDGSNGLYLTLADKAQSGVFPVNAQAIPENNTFSMWTYQYPGYLVSNVNDELVLSLELGSGGTIESPAFMDNIVAYPRQPGAQSFQLWTVTNDGLIINQRSGKALTIPAPSSPPASSYIVSTNSIQSGTPNPYQVWDFSPGRALRVVLQQPAVAFNTGTADEQKAYNYLCSELGLPGGIRAQYQNLTAPMSSYQAQINMIAVGLATGRIKPDGSAITAADIPILQDVAEQLQKEITAVISVQLLFQQATTLYLSLSQAQAMMLADLITNCAFTAPVNTKVPPHKKSKSWIWDLVEGILYTGMNLAGAGVGEIKDAGFVVKNVLPCFANVMAAGFTSGQSYLTGNTQTDMTKLHTYEQNIYNFEMTVAELQQGLLDEFEELGNALGRIEALILGDAYKLQAVFDMCRGYGNMSSLFWPSIMAAMDTDEMLKVYSQGVLKVLLPANPDFQIKATMHCNYGSRLSEGWHDSTLYINNADGTQNSYIGVNLSAQLMNMVWASGADGNAFFAGLNGWALDTEYQGLMAESGDTNYVPTAASSLVIIENFTNVALAVTLQLDNLAASDYQTNGSSIPVAPYGSIQIAGGSFATPDQMTSGGTAKNYWAHAMYTQSTPGVSITANGQMAAQFDINNSTNQQTYKTVAEIPAPTYTIGNFSQSSPFNCNIKIRYGTYGMAFIQVAITA
ncbi:hypothetical protein [Sinomicrobium sp. M5D2P9]